MSAFDKPSPVVHRVLEDELRDALDNLARLHEDVLRRRADVDGTAAALKVAKRELESAEDRLAAALARVRELQEDG